MLNSVSLQKTCHGMYQNKTFSQDSQAAHELMKKDDNLYKNRAFPNETRLILTIICTARNRLKDPRKHFYEIFESVNGIIKSFPKRCHRPLRSLCDLHRRVSQNIWSVLELSFCLSKSRFNTDLKMNKCPVVRWAKLAMSEYRILRSSRNK